MNISVEYSNAVYTTQNISSYRLRKLLDSPEISYIQLDGYTLTPRSYIDDNVYLCRCIFNRNICSIRNEKLYIQPNIFVNDITSYLMPEIVQYKENIKFALLNHGLTLTDDAIELAQQKGQIKKAVFDAIDITIFENVKVNVPFGSNFNTLSPFTIDAKNGDFVLLFDDYEITNVHIDFITEKLSNRMTVTGVPFDSIIHLATDRVPSFVGDNILVSLSKDLVMCLLGWYFLKFVCGAYFVWTGIGILAIGAYGMYNIIKNAEKNKIIRSAIMLGLTVFNMFGAYYAYQLAEL